MGRLQSVYVGPVVSWGMWSATVGGVELHATSCLNGAYTPWPQTLGVVWPLGVQGQVMEEPEFWGASFLSRGTGLAGLTGPAA